MAKIESSIKQDLEIGLKKNAHRRISAVRIKTGTWIALFFAMLLVVASGIADNHNRLSDKYKPDSLKENAEITLISILEYPMPMFNQFFESSFLVGQIAGGSEKK